MLDNLLECWGSPFHAPAKRLAVDSVRIVCICIDILGYETKRKRVKIQL